MRSAQVAVHLYIEMVLHATVILTNGRNDSIPDMYTTFGGATVAIFGWALLLHIVHFITVLNSNAGNADVYLVAAGVRIARRNVVQRNFQLHRISPANQRCKEYTVRNCMYRRKILLLFPNAETPAPTKPSYSVGDR
ncbi:hypothetical protein DL93DRAFT_803418 [Clavulina sp. PMI_390]|nr:hypothetical protein DL93DRAFT_803418 [Clavulina sp. PMI_390]